MEYSKPGYRIDLPVAAGRNLLSVSCFFLFLAGAVAQSKTPDWIKRIDPVLGIQVWSVYTVNEAVFNRDSSRYERIRPRLNTIVRRTRFGVRSELFEGLKVELLFGLDQVGKEALSGAPGSANNGSSPVINPLNAFVAYSLPGCGQALNLTAGYFTPQFGRESVTGSFRVSSMEKAASQTYMRRHIFGPGPGRLGGINAGGLLLDTALHIGCQYDFGVFNPVFDTYGSNSSGDYSPVVWVGRAVFSIGDPESKTYKQVQEYNFFNRRKGLSIGIGLAGQGAEAGFLNNQAFNLDVLINWKAFNLAGEWDLLKRRSSLTDNGHAEVRAYRADTGCCRLSWNFHMRHNRFLEPVVTAAVFKGPMDPAGQKTAEAMKLASGKDYSLEAGVNLHLMPRKLKVNLHYTWRCGDAGSAGSGSTVNAYFSQPEVGAITRGNWLGLGLLAMY